ncbi:hypothetical protein [Parvicella tangerina]|uniref:Uncharacterized protein n=1 Tax=Parvicella tangerina TaxID=2829795 RepID=A0A916JNI3_9FLAO|nr:hypothetical protein [Parvicella tangerina]CAG5082927.1 hypothetical protein CRYO30217_02045 [Parvicella tangerina]
MNKAFPILFILTGCFAILGALYTWGDGNIFNQHELAKILIPWADLILTGPLSLVSGIGMLKEKKWGTQLALVTSGIYIFGSVLVFITIIWKADFDILLIVPAASGFVIAVLYVLEELNQSSSSP